MQLHPTRGSHLPPKTSNSAFLHCDAMTQISSMKDQLREPAIVELSLWEDCRKTNPIDSQFGPTSMAMCSPSHLSGDGNRRNREIFNSKRHCNSVRLPHHTAERCHFQPRSQTSPELVAPATVT